MSSDRESFGEVFREHHAAAVRLAYRLCHDYEAAEEATADAFARVFPKYEDGGIDNVGAYVRRATVNAVRSSQRRLPHLRLERTRRTGDHRGGLDPAQHLADREEARALLARLPARQRTAIVLRFWADLPDTAGATVMGCSVGTYRSLVSRGLARLRDVTASRATQRHAEV